MLWLWLVFYVLGRLLLYGMLLWQMLVEMRVSSTRTGLTIAVGHGHTADDVLPLRPRRSVLSVAVPVVV